MLYLRLVLIDVVQNVVDKGRAHVERAFGKAELDLVAQFELIGVEEAAVLAPVDDAFAVVTSCESRVVDREEHCCQGIAVERFDESDLVCICIYTDNQSLHLQIDARINSTAYRKIVDGRVGEGLH